MLKRVQKKRRIMIYTHCTLHTTHSHGRIMIYTHCTCTPHTCTLPWTQWVASVDLFANEDADANIVVTATDSWTQQGEEVIPS